MFNFDKKINVVKTTGQSGALGVMDAKVNMVTNEGTITATGDVIKVGSGTNYAGLLFITEAQASGSWSWPSGDGSIKHGHGQAYTSGDNAGANKLHYLKGDGTVGNTTR